MQVDWLNLHLFTPGYFGIFWGVCHCHFTYFGDLEILSCLSAGFLLFLAAAKLTSDFNTTGLFRLLVSVFFYGRARQCLHSIFVVFFSFSIRSCIFQTLCILSVLLFLLIFYPCLCVYSLMSLSLHISCWVTHLLLAIFFF